MIRKSEKQDDNYDNYGKLPDSRGLKTKTILGCTAIGLVAGGLYNLSTGVVNGVNHLYDLASPEYTIDAQSQEITEIDLKLAKKSFTAFNFHFGAEAKMAFDLLGAEVWNKVMSVFAEVQNEFTMNANSAEIRVDMAGKDIVVRIKAESIVSELVIDPVTLSLNQTQSPTAVPGEVAELFVSSIPTEFTENLNKLNNVTENDLRNTAIVAGMKQASSSCGSQAWSVVAPAFVNHVKDDILQHINLVLGSNDKFTREDITVLIGDAKTEADNLNQKVGENTSVDEAYANIMKTVDGNDSRNTKLIIKNTGSDVCQFPDYVKQEALEELKGN